MTTVDDATLQQIEGELGADGVWVAPEMREQVPPAAERRIEAAVAEARTPTYVALVDLPSGDPLTNGDAAQLASVIRDDTGRAGVYVGLAQHFGDEPYQLEITSFPDDSGLFYAARVAAAEHPDDLGAQTVRALDLLRTGGAESLYEKLSPEERSPGAAPDVDDDGSVGAGSVIGVVVLLAAVVAGVVVRRRRSARRGAVLPRSASASARAPFTLPDAVLGTVRAAEDHRNESRANTDVLALGEAIDAAEIDPSRARALPAWQAALDHYDVARRILDRSHSPADAIGAIALAARGRAALAAAVRGRSWTPGPSCYFNPLHGSAAGRVRWRDADTSVRVPACTECAKAVQAGGEPEDVLDFVSDRTAVHYFKLDLGVWSETGYGSLDADLLGRLIRA